MVCNECGQQFPWGLYDEPISAICQDCNSRINKSKARRTTLKCKTCVELFSYNLYVGGFNGFQKHYCNDCASSDKSGRVLTQIDILKEVPKRYQNASLDVLSEGLKRNLLANQNGICLWGESEHYRSFAIVGLAKYQLMLPNSKLKSFKYIDVLTLFSDAVKSLNDKTASSQSAIIKKLQNVDVLCLSGLDEGDDGKTLSRSRKEILIKILRHRHDQAKVTNVTMNKPPKAMSGVFGPDIVEYLNALNPRMIYKTDFKDNINKKNAG